MGKILEMCHLGVRLFNHKRIAEIFKIICPRKKGLMETDTKGMVVTGRGWKDG